MKSMRSIIPTLFDFFPAGRSIPVEYRRNFFHLYLDVTWWGVLVGSTMAFIAVYAARLGASGTQIGLINAAPAIMTLIFALPAGDWLSRRSLHKSLFWVAVVNRLFYLALVPLPWLFNAPSQIWAIIAISLVMNLPGAVFAVGFTAFYGDSVPSAYRAHVTGVRNAGVSIFTTATSLICGRLLTDLPFPVGYQIVFGLGFFGAAMSCVHLRFVRPILDPTEPVRPDVKQGQAGLNLDIIRGPYGRVVLLLTFFHFAQYIAIPVFTLYQVNILKFTDQVIALGGAIFYVATFLGSLQLEKITRRLGNHRVTGIGVMMLGAYPLLLSFSYYLPVYIVASLVGGTAWALAGGALYNYLLEHVPANRRPAYLAWYNLGLNAAILAGSLIGPELTVLTGFVPALILFAILRVSAGAAIFKWGGVRDDFSTQPQLTQRVDGIE